MGTQTTQLATKPQTGVSAYNDADIAAETRILKSAFPKMNIGDGDARALIIASRMSGLNPFRGEIYYVPTIGITIAAKVRAGDAITHQQRMGNTLDIKFEKVTPETCIGVYAQFSDAVQKGDVAVACRIISSKQRTEHYKWRIQLADEGRVYGYHGKELETWVNERAGIPPEIIALGIVKATEGFGGDAKYGRFDRASKRALTLALAKGGWHAPDTRNYGGVPLEEERESRKDTAIEGEFREMERNIPQKPSVTMPEWTEGDSAEPPLPSSAATIDHRNDEVIEPPKQPVATFSADLDYLHNVRVSDLTPDTAMPVAAKVREIAERNGVHMNGNAKTLESAVKYLKAALETKIPAN